MVSGSITSSFLSSYLPAFALVLVQEGLLPCLPFIDLYTFDFDDELF